MSVSGGSSAREQKPSRFRMRIVLGSGGGDVPDGDPYVCRDVMTVFDASVCVTRTATSNALRK
jgi:hypothetical protein